MKPIAVLAGLVLALILGLGLFLLMGRNGASPSDGRSAAYLDPGSMSSLEASVRQLSTQIEALRAQWVDRERSRPAGEPPSQATRTPVGGDLDQVLRESLQPLQRSIDELASTIAQMEAATRDAARLGSELRPPEQPVAPQVFADLQALPEVDRDLRHHGWSMQQVLDRYGAPTRMAPSPNGVGEKFYYERPDGSEVVFWFIDGRLAKIS